MPFEIETIPAIPFLAELREEVLKHSLKRMPKWKFRFAPDIVVQLQPKPTVLPSEAAMARGFKPNFHLFEGIAVMMESVTADALKRLPQQPCPPAASMARWIGPECAGTSTLHVPFVIANKLNEAAA